MDPRRTSWDEKQEGETSQQYVDPLIEQINDGDVESSDANNGFQGEYENDESSANVSHDELIQFAVDAATEQILNSQEVASQPSPGLANNAHDSADSLQSLIQQLLSQGAGASSASGRGPTTSSRPIQPPTPSVIHNPQMFQTLSRASAPMVIPSLPQNPLAQLLASPQAFTAILPLFGQWLQLLSQGAPSQQQQQQQQQCSALVQLLQQLLASSSQATDQVDIGSVIQAFVQSFTYFQLQQQSGLQRQLPSPLMSASSYASLLSMFAPPAQPPVTGLNTTLPFGAAQPVASAALTMSGNRTQESGTAAVAGTAETSPRKRRRYNLEAFPQKLHRLITEAAANNIDSIVRFTEDGTMFQILNAKEFKKLLPEYFRHSNISSFKRLLRMYGFKRVQGTWSEGTFWHPKFRRDEPDECKEIERVERGYGALY